LSGTQASVLTSKIGSYKPKKTALDNAKRAPHTGSASTDAINTAQRACDRAWGDVTTAYDSYDRSMRAAGHTPRSLNDFLSDYGTSRP